MAATAAIVATVVAAAGTGVSLYEQNQARQQAKGAAQAEQTAMQQQLDTAQKQTDANTKAKSDAGSSTQAAALAALRASMSTTGQMGGSILTGPQGAAPAPISGKTLLGQ